MTPAELKERREAIPLTQGELARHCGVSVQSIRHWEAGRRTPRPPQLRRLQRALSVERESARCSCGPCPIHRAPSTARTGRKNWTSAENADLRRWISDGMTPQDVLAAINRAHGNARTMYGLSSRCRRLGLSFWNARSGTEVAGLLGVPYSRVTHWIAGGWLPAVRSVDSKYGRPTHWWRLEPSDIEAFVERYAGVEFEPGRVRDRALRARAELAAAVNRRRAS